MNTKTQNTRHRSITAVIAAIVLLLSGFSGVGCGIIAEPVQHDRVSIAFVTGVHQGSVYPDFNADKVLLIDALTRAEPSELHIYNATGEVSSSVFNVDIDWNAPKTTVEYSMQSYFADRLEPAIEATILPLSNGANYIEAIKQAAHYLSEEQADEKIIYISGNGLSDTGILKLAEGGYLDSEKTSAEIVKELSTQITFDNSLAGFTIIWNDLGSTSSPQEALTPHELDMLKNIYISILCEYGMERENLHIATPGTHTGAVMPTDKTVTLVPVIHDDFHFGETYDETSALGFIGDRPAYIGDSEDFIDDTAATTELQRIAEIAKQHPSRTITITGYIALLEGAEISDHNDLSQRRAETVRNKLVELGVTNEIIIVDRGNSESSQWARQEDRRVQIEF